MQGLNPKETVQLRSHDYLAEVDDPYGYLADALNESVLHKYRTNGVPNHLLELKVDDICLVTRALKASDLATNSGVRVLEIQKKVIKVLVLDGSDRIVLLLRIRFKFSLHFGQSYKMIRTQFPLRLAYAMTYNTSQSQSFSQCLVDIVHEPFAHGHLYVALSRIRDRDRLRLYVNKDQRLEANGELADDGTILDSTCSFLPVVTNIVYREILN